MRKFICRILLFICLLSIFPAASSAALVQRNDSGEIIYASSWNSGIWKLIDFSRGPDYEPGGWLYLLKIELAQPYRISEKAARISIDGYYYDLPPQFSKLKSKHWELYFLGEQLPGKKTLLLQDIEKAKRVSLRLILHDGNTVQVELPSTILEEWKNILRLNLK